MSDDKKKRDEEGEESQRGAVNNYGTQVNHFSSTQITQTNKRGNNIVSNGDNQVYSGNSNGGQTRVTRTVITGSVSGANIVFPGSSQIIHGDTIIQSNENGTNMVVRGNNSTKAEVPDNGARDLLWEKKREIDALRDQIAAAGADEDTIGYFKENMKLLHKSAIEYERQGNLVGRMIGAQNAANELNNAALTELLRQYLGIVNTVMYY